MSYSRRNVYFSNSLQQRDLHLEVQRIIEGLPSDGGEFCRVEYLKSTLLSKFADPDPELSTLRSTAAYEKLRATETRNRETVHRLKTPVSIHGISSSALLFTARRYIIECLGDFDIDELFSRSEFSNGASISRRRGESSKYEKFDGSSAISASALPYLLTLVKGSSLLKNYFLYQQLVGGGWANTESNQLFTVPKSNDIDRVAAKEPDWNMFFQKGLGSMIRHRLRKVNIDLNDQTVNRELARLGSLDGSLSTLDLSSASDSVTEELVFQLIPADWFKHLSALRSTLGRFPDGTTHKWILMSTMGNGFTFELESLIFWALSKSVAYHFGVRGRISLYGDDFIVPTGMTTYLVELLGYCGFLVNSDKSFTTGFFRESCGGHYYKGLDVTPIYIRRPLTLQDLIGFINKFREWSCVNTNGVGDPRYFEFLEKLESLLPPWLLQRVKGGGFPISVSPHGNVNRSKPVTYLCGPGQAKHSVVEKTVIFSDNQLLNRYLAWHYQKHNSPFNEDETSLKVMTTPTKLRLVKRRENPFGNVDTMLFPQEMA